MNKTIFMFRTVTLRPHWFQYIINETGSLCLLVASIWIYKFCSFAYHEWLSMLASCYCSTFFSS